MGYYDNFIKGLRIFQKYDPKNSTSHETFTFGSHKLFVGPDPADMTEKDKQRLKELGFHEEEAFECWGWYA